MPMTDRFVAVVRERCASLDSLPGRGTPRDDLRPGPRTTAISRRATIGYVAAGDDVVIVAIAYRGQNLDMLIGRDGD